MMEVKTMPRVMTTEQQTAAVFIITHNDKVLMLKRRMMSGLCLPILSLIKKDWEFCDMKARLKETYGLDYRGSYREAPGGYTIHSYGRERPLETNYRVFELKATDPDIIEAMNITLVDYYQWIDKKLVKEMLTDPLHEGTVSIVSKRLLTSVI
jgi:hypothetical protein